MESTKTGMNRPLNKMDLRKVLSQMENDYEKINLYILNYEKDYYNTINNISMDDIEKSHFEKNYKNINDL